MLKWKGKLVATKDDKEHPITHWKHKSDEVCKELKALRKNVNSTLVELERVRTKLRDFENSGKLISGLATPLCLFGALIIVHVVCFFLYTNSGVSKHQANIQEDPEYPMDEIRDYGRPKIINGSNIDHACDPSYVTMKPSFLDSGLPQYRSDRPPKYLSGGKVDRLSSSHSQYETGVDIPCVACASTQQRQIPQRLRTYSQQSHQQHLHQHAHQQLQFIPDNQTLKQNAMLVNQNDSNQHVQRKAGDITVEARGSEKKARTHNEAESGAFKLAQLDFNPDQQQSKHQECSKTP